MEQKYKFTGETREFRGRTLRQIQAVKDFDAETCHVSAGTLGGWLSSEDNLEQSGNCWVFRDAYVMDNAVVSENAAVAGVAKVYGHAAISGHGVVGESAEVSGYASVRENAVVCGCANVNGCAVIAGGASVRDLAEIGSYAVVHGMSRVRGETELKHDEVVSGNWIVFYEHELVSTKLAVGDDLVTVAAFDTGKQIEYANTEFCGPAKPFIKRFKRKCKSWRTRRELRKFIRETRKLFRRRRYERDSE